MSAQEVHVEVVQWIVSLVTSTVAAAGFSWLFKQALERALDRSLQRDMERYKSELQLQSQNQVERLKSELQLQAQQQLELIRHEMQKQMLRAQLVTPRTQEVYSQLIKNIRRAEGAVGGLWGLSRESTFEKFSAEDIERVLKDAKAPGEEQREILEMLKTNREAAIKWIRDVLRRKQMHDARRECQEAKNHLILEGIFMTSPVRDLAVKICEKLWKAYASVEVSEDLRGMGPTGINFHEQYDSYCKQVAEEIPQLEDAMRADLLPGFVGPRLDTPRTSAP